MDTLLLFVLAALIFSLLAGWLEIWLSRHARGQVLARTALPLHPFAHRGFPRVRSSPARRRLRYLELFLGFLLATYLGMVLVKAVHHVLSGWLS